MGEILNLFLWILLVSFTCSLMESVLIAVSPTFIALSKSENRPYAQLLEHLRGNINRPLTAIIVLNTITNTLGAALLAAKVYRIFGESFVTLVTIFLTLMIVIVGEIIPKTLGANYWRYLVPIATYVIQFFVIILYPVVWLSESATRKIRQSRDYPGITRAEVIATAELGAEEGEIKKQESKIIKNLLTLNNLYVSDIMTPRSVIFALPCQMTVGDVFEKYKPLRFSRIPVYEGDMDHILGVVMRYRIQECLSADQDSTQLKDLVQPVNKVSEKMTVSGLLEFLIRKKTHIAMVYDEYGVLSGLVTLEDAIETLLGVEIVDELDQVSDMRQWALELFQNRKNQSRQP